MPLLEQDKPQTLQGTVALVGNPNVGKSVIFGRLTGRYVTVSNYPGTTVDVSRGSGNFGGTVRQVVDTPGILSLFPKSEDERVSRDLLLRERPSAVIQVADAKNLRRSLVVTLELALLKIPMVLVLNMSDEAGARGIEIDAKRLSAMLGIPVIEAVATTGQGIEALRRAVSEARVPTVQARYLSEVSAARERIAALLPESMDTEAGKEAFTARSFTAETLLYRDPSIWKALSLLSPTLAQADLQAQATDAAQKTVQRFARQISILAMDSRQQMAGEIVAEVVRTTGVIRSSWAQAFGRMAMRPWPGYLIAAGMLFLMYEFVGVFGAQFLVNLLEKGLFGQILIPLVTKIVQAVVPTTFLQEMLVGPYGLFSMALTYALALIFPIVSCFFFFFGLLEDSGYLPRLSIMLDRVFRVMGLNGRAVLPMILGLGCDTMAMLTTRVLESEKEKVIVAILLTLSVPCSAQIGAILGMMAGLSWKIFAIWMAVVCGTMVSVGWGAAKVLPGVRSPFLMEIPPIRVPQIGNLLKKIRARLEWYVKEAVPMFMLGTFILFLSDKIGLLELVKKLGTPLVVHFLGLPEKATESFIIGFLRRDYGAAGFFMMARDGLLTAAQVAVAVVVITLFMPCIAQFFVTIRERGLRAALIISAFVMSVAVLVGGFVSWLLRTGWLKV